MRASCVQLQVSLQVELCEHNSKKAQFRIMPRFKVKSEGDLVQVSDQVVFESVKSSNQFLHVSKKTFSSDYLYAGM